MKPLILCVFCCWWHVNLLAKCADITLKHSLDSAQLSKDLFALSDDNMQGRKTNTLGAERARTYIAARFKQLGLADFSADAPYSHAFTLKRTWSETRGINMLAWLPGTTLASQYIIVSAHYDHLGVRGRKTFNGADDNASGVAAMLAIAAYLSQYPSKHSIIFVATDAEEKGLYGSKAFLIAPPVPRSQIIYNLNLDMLAEGTKRKRLYFTTSRKKHSLHKLIPEMMQEVAENAGLCLVKAKPMSFTTDSRANRINWRRASDHASFARFNIPYVYLGVGMHPRYHSEQDTAERIDPLFFTAAAETSLSLLLALDKKLSLRPRPTL